MRRNMKTITGFTLIEVLIAMLVLAVGLLGLAGLQATSLKNYQSAYNRSQATQLAYDLADRMRANVTGLTSYTTGAAAEKANCRITTDGSEADTAADDLFAGCSQADMAANDLFEWNSAISTVLPSGVGTVTIADGVYTIAITWDDDRDGDDSNNPNFQMSFQP